MRLAFDLDGRNQPHRHEQDHASAGGDLVDASEPVGRFERSKVLRVRKIERHDQAATSRPVTPAYAMVLPELINLSTMNRDGSTRAEYRNNSPTASLRRDSSTATSVACIR